MCVFEPIPYKSVKVYWANLTFVQSVPLGWALSHTGCQSQTRCQPLSCRYLGIPGLLLLLLSLLLLPRYSMFVSHSFFRPILSTGTLSKNRDSARAAKNICLLNRRRGFWRGKNGLGGGGGGALFRTNLLYDILNIMDGQVSHRCNSITQTWYCALLNYTLSRKCMNKQSSKEETYIWPSIDLKLFFFAQKHYSFIEFFAYFLPFCAPYSTKKKM